MPGRGLFITLEGSDGTGKSSQIRLLARAMGTGRRKCLVTEEPGGTVLGRKLRRLLLDPATGALNPRTEALLYEAARAEHVEKVIRPALRSGQNVLCSRFFDSTLAYQGGARGLGLRDLAKVDRWARAGLKPDLTLVLVLPPALGLRRTRNRGRADRMEAEGASFQAKVAAAFRLLARREPRRIKLIDARGSREEVAARVLKVLGARVWK